MRIGIPPWTNEDLKADLSEFTNIYYSLPIKYNKAGNTSVGLFYFWFCLKRLNPKVIIENGVWKGATTWLFETTAPAAKIYSLDPCLKKREYISERATYSSKDFSQWSWDFLKDDALVFFDDHQNQLMRLTQSAKNGFKYLIFDDNYPEFCGTRHLSLEAILEQRHEDTSEIPKTSRDFLLSAIQTYYVFPPIFSHDKPITLENSIIQQEPLLRAPSPGYEIYRKEMDNYRWPTFVELKSDIGMPLPIWQFPSYRKIKRSPIRAILNRLSRKRSEHHV